MQTHEIHQKGNTNSFEFQEIVTISKNNQNWYEMLFRPPGMESNINVDSYFMNMSKNDKISFDIKILKSICCYQKNNKIHRISINISPYSLCDKGFLSCFNYLIENRSLNSKLICLEIVETEKLEELSIESINLLKKLRQLGAWVALDDFGNGFAHWQLLKLGIVDVIKVINNNISKTALPDSFISGLAKFARTQTIQTVLEGIETDKDFNNGIKLGFENFQGYLFNKQSI